MFEQPPMPARVVLHATVRENGSKDGIPVARVQFTDVLDVSKEMDFDPATAMDLALQLLRFVRQVGLNSTGT